MRLKIIKQSTSKGDTYLHPVWRQVGVEGRKVEHKVGRRAGPFLACHIIDVGAVGGDSLRYRKTENGLLDAFDVESLPAAVEGGGARSQSLVKSKPSTCVVPSQNVDHNIHLSGGALPCLLSIWAVLTDTCTADSLGSPLKCYCVRKAFFGSMRLTRLLEHQKTRASHSSLLLARTITSNFASWHPVSPFPLPSCRLTPN